MLRKAMAAVGAAGLLSVGMIAPASANSETPPGVPFDLITNGGSVEESIDIGDVFVDGLKVTVVQDPAAKFNTDNPKPIVLTGVVAEAGCEEADFPLNKKQNLIPGKMTQPMTQVSDYVWTVELADPGCANPKIAVHADATQEYTSGLEAIDFKVADMGQVTFSVRTDFGNDPDASYFDTTVTVAGQNGETFDGWCIDVGHGISPNRNYTGVLATWDSGNTGNVDKPENLPAVAWLINTYSPGDVITVVRPDTTTFQRTLSSGDLQRAIWYLVDNSQTNPGGNFNDLAAKQIAAEALDAQADGFTYDMLVEEFGCAAQIPVIVLPTNGGVQTTLIQTTFILLDVECEGYEGGSGTAMALDTSKTEVENGSTRYGNQFDGDNWFGYVQVAAEPAS